MIQYLLLTSTVSCKQSGTDPETPKASSRVLRLSLPQKNPMSQWAQKRREDREIASSGFVRLLTSGWDENWRTGVRHPTVTSKLIRDEQQ